MRAPYGLNILDNCLTCPVREEHVFCNLSVHAGQRLNEIKSTAVYPKGAMLFIEGQQPRGVFVLCAGKAKLSTSSREGKTIITKLSDAGGKFFLVTKLGASYRQPTLRETSYGTRLKQQFLALNKQLEHRMEKLAAKLGVTIVLFDYWAVTEAIFDRPAGFGLTNVDDGYLSVGGNPDEFFWWDDFHLTRAAHRIVADAVGKLVSEKFARR